MPRLSKYHIFTYDNGKFKDNKDQTNVFNYKDAEMIFRRFESQMFKNKSKEAAQRLELAINAAIQENQNQYDTLLRNFVNNIDNYIVKQLVQNTNTNNNLFTVSQGSFVINRTAFEHFQKTHSKNFIQDIEGNKLSFAQVNNSINKFRGDMFEYILAVMLQNANYIIDRVATDNINELFTDFRKLVSLLSSNLKNPKDLKSIDMQRTLTGSKIKPSFDVEIWNRDGENTIDTVTVRGGQVKSDMVIGDYPGREYLSASLKNYGVANSRIFSRTISFLNKGRIASLIEQWPVSNHLRNLAMNGLSANDIKDTQFTIMRRIFFLQAVRGSGGLDFNSDYLIINTGKPNYPIRVFSIYNLFFGDDYYTQYNPLFMDGKTKGIEYDGNYEVPRSDSFFFDFFNRAVVSFNSEMSLKKLLES